jgi:lipopolysaccharide transport system ATP-binding protein
MEGPPEAVMDYYNALLAERGETRIEQEQTADGGVATQSGTGTVSIEAVKLVDLQGASVVEVQVGQPVSLLVRAQVHTATEQLVMGYMIKDRLGQTIYGTNTHHLNQTLYDLERGAVIDFNAHFLVNLGEGSYSVSVALHASDTHIGGNYEWKDRALVFQVINVGKEHFVGSTWMAPTLEIKQ